MKFFVATVNLDKQDELQDFVCGRQNHEILF